MYNVAFWGETKQISVYVEQKYVGKNVPGCYFVFCTLLVYLFDHVFLACWCFWPYWMSVQKCRNCNARKLSPLFESPPLKGRSTYYSVQCTNSLWMRYFISEPTSLLCWGKYSFKLRRGYGVFLKSFLLVQYKILREKNMLYAFFFLF